MIINKDHNNQFKTTTTEEVVTSTTKVVTTIQFAGFGIDPSLTNPKIMDLGESFNSRCGLELE